MNKVELIGRLTKDPELSTTMSGQNVCTFSLAISRTFKNQNGERETDFINIVCWNTIADNCYKFLKKGRQVAVYGRIQTRTYDAQDGTKRTAIEVVAEEVEFLGGTKEDEQSSSSHEQKPKITKINEEDDNLPF